MRLKLDPFTWIVMLVIAGLVIAAIVTVNVAGSGAVQNSDYRNADEPATPVYNALLAIQRGDATTARSQFTQSALDEMKKRGYDPIQSNLSSYVDNRTSRRIRIVSVTEDSPDVIYVTVVEDIYGNGGLFGSSTWSNQRVVRVVRSDGQWKIDDSNFFY